jgi:hypothetical protein
MKPSASPLRDPGKSSSSTSLIRMSVEPRKVVQALEEAPGGQRAQGVSLRLAWRRHRKARRSRRAQPRSPAAIAPERVGAVTTVCYEPGMKERLEPEGETITLRPPDVAQVRSRQARSRIEA